MSAFKPVRAAFALVVTTLVGACSLIADFDASKLPHDQADAALGGAAGLSGAGGSLPSAGGMIGMGGLGPLGGFPSGGQGAGGTAGRGAGGMLPDMDASMDATMGDGGAAGAAGAAGQAGKGGVGGRDAGPPPPKCNVSTNAGCAADELCCPFGQGVTCRKTSLNECEQCGVACPVGLTSTCSGRSCQCEAGSNRVCSGQDDERFCIAGPPVSCVACRDSTDCVGRPDGKARCVANQCVQCDPAGNLGCTGNTPICDAATHTCKACTSSPDDCTKPLVCTTGGACGHCASAGDCSTLTSPICDATTTQCRPCATNAECVAGPKLPYCVNQLCSSCNPATEAGCTDATKPDCRGDATGGYSCQACINNGNCASRPTTPVCDTGTGRCVICSSDNDCPNAKAPLCVNNACAACDSSSAIASVADQRCAVKAGGQPVCVRTGTQKGQCGACDPGDARGCTPSQLCCESAGVAACLATSPTQCGACSASACNPLLADTCTNRACRCGTTAPCAGTGTQRFCVASTCSECRTDVDCTSPTAPLCEGNACVGCDEAASSNARCAAKQAGSVCATTGAQRGRCGVCDPASNTGCSDATLDECDPTTATCVDCVDNAGCSGTLDHCNVATEKCVDCDVTGGCSAPLDRCNLSTHQCVDCDAMGGCSAPLDHCDLTMQTCIDCDQTGGCEDVPATPICIASVCTACTNDAQCAQSPPTAAGPLCAGGLCLPDIPCASSLDCMDSVHTVCAGLQADGGGTGRCRVCDPATNAGCPATLTCSVDFVCAG